MSVTAERALVEGEIAVDDPEGVLRKATGPCTFGVSDDVLVDPSAASAPAIPRVVAGCPSGALAFALKAGCEPHASPSK